MITIRKQTNGQAVKVAALAATVTGHQREACKAVRFDGPIANPIGMGELWVTVDAMML